MKPTIDGRSYSDYSMAALQSTDELMKSYARWRSHRLGRITDRLEQELVFDLLGALSDKTLLDVGCGDAVLAVEVAHRGGVVTGLDANPVMIAAGRQRTKLKQAQLTLLVGRAENLPFDDSTFDLVLAVATLCFIKNAEQATREMARVLKPGGRLVIGELGRWSFWSAYRRIRGWLGEPTWRAVRFRTATELCRLVSAAGLIVGTVRGAAFYPPWGAAAQLFAPVDLWVGRKMTFGAAFIAVSATKQAGMSESVR